MVEEVGKYIYHILLQETILVHLYIQQKNRTAETDQASPVTPEGMSDKKSGINLFIEKDSNQRKVKCAMGNCFALPFIKQYTNEYFRFIMWIFDKCGQLKTRFLDSCILHQLGLDNCIDANNNQKYIFKKVFKDQLCDVSEEKENCPVFIPSKIYTTFYRYTSSRKTTMNNRVQCLLQ